MKYLNAAVGLALMLSSCSKNDPLSRGELAPDPLPAVSYKDVSYGSDAKQKLDVYLPANRTGKTRLLIVIHGGGWNSGDKSDFDSFVSEFQKQLPGYALANLNYRLVTASGNYFPTQENDINAAITFLKNNTREYNISQEFVYLGISAGAHLALLQGYKHADVIKPKGIVSFFGPVDLERLYVNTNNIIPAQLRNILNSTLEFNPNIFYESSPINYVTSDAPPTLLLHGDKDKLVPVEQAYMLQDKLEEKGVFHKLIVYPGQGHGWIGADLEDSFRQVHAFVVGLTN